MPGNESDGRIAALLEGRRANLREQRQKDRAEKLSDKLLISPDRAAPIKVDLADTEARAELQATKLKLRETQEKLRELDPLVQPIASLSSTVEIIAMVGAAKESSSYNGEATGIAFVKGRSFTALAQTILSNYTKLSETTVKFRFTADVAADSEIMGQPVRSLSMSEYLQIGLPDTLFSTGTQIESGTITWVINNRTRLRFSVPAQKTVALPNGDKSTAFVRILDSAPMKELSR
jgi:hypothetical protein